MWWAPAAWSLQRRHGNGLFHTPTLTVFQMMGKVARLLVVSPLVMVIVGRFKDMRSELDPRSSSTVTCAPPPELKLCC